MISIKNITNMILQQHCLLCDIALHDNTKFCSACFDSLPQHKTGCAQCASTLINTSDNVCGQCIQHAPPFDRILPLFQYETPITSFIHRLKFSNELKMASLLSTCFIEKIKQNYAEKSMPELIIPVPLHPLRLQERGFNQSLEIAKPIGRFFHIPIDIKSCIRIKNTTAQSTLSAKLRKKNIKHAFALSRTINAKHIVILDDVVTTASTVSDMSALLKKAGARKVEVWCCARA